MGVEAGKGKGMDFPLEPLESNRPVDTLILAQRDQCQISNLRKGKNKVVSSQ